MKLRQAFVSNSSSSSFILATDPKNAKKKIRITIECDAHELIDKTITNKKELEEWYLEEYGYDTLEEMFEDSYGREEYNQALKQLEMGKVILIGDCSNESYEIVSRVVFDNGLEGNIDETEYKIIRDAEH